jgi:transposase
MSLHPQAAYPIPEETQRLARAAFPRGHRYRQVADRLGPIDQDAPFAARFPRRGQPAEAPARLALVTVLQCAEGFSDRQAAAAVRSRSDGTYVLGVELTDPGFHQTVLSEFRTRLVTEKAASQLLDALRTLARAQGLLTTRGRQRTDSTSVVAAMRLLNGLERVGETRRVTLNSLAIVAPAWWQAGAPLEWYDRSSRRVENYQLPKTDAARKALAVVIGADGQTRLHAMAAAADQPWLQVVPAVNTLQQVWAEPYLEVHGRLSWREVKDIPSPAELIASPDDPEARYSTTREVEWGAIRSI